MGKKLDMPAAADAAALVNQLEAKALRSEPLQKTELLAALNLDGGSLPLLTGAADRVRAALVGDAVYLRGIVELSNICAKNCAYCGIRAGNTAVRRYQMDPEEVLAVCRKMVSDGCTTVVLQAGEFYGGFDREFRELVAMIRQETGLRVTGSVGVRSADLYREWHGAGMDRYLLRFECSDPGLYRSVHPDSDLDERLQALRDLQEAGVQTGSGFMIGIPGETLETVAENIMLCRTMELDMIGVGPFIPHPSTPLAGSMNAWAGRPHLPYAVIALLRLANPVAHIPATTAFDAWEPGSGRNRLLTGGANVFMPNMTPAAYRGEYLLYPDKPCVDESPDQCSRCVRARIEMIGRTVGTGPGDAYRIEHGGGSGGGQV